MKRIKAFNQFAILLCFLLYLTCYLRFIGQAFLGIVQIISAIIVTIDVYSQSINACKQKIKIFWIATLINLAVIVAFFETILNNDFLQFPFISILPNLLAFYFMGILNQLIENENAVKNNQMS